MKRSSGEKIRNSDESLREEEEASVWLCASCRRGLH